MKKNAKSLIFFGLVLLSCTGLSPESKHATFLFFDNNTSEILSFEVDNSNHFALKPWDKISLPIEPGMHIIEMDYGSITFGAGLGPDTIYVAPCEIESLSYGYKE